LSAQILDGKATAARVRADLKERVAALEAGVSLYFTGIRHFWH